MNDKAKKPPISLNDLGSGGREEERGKPGELSYAASPGSSGGGDGTAGRDWKGLVGSLIIAVFLSGLLILFLTPSKADVTTLDENIQEVSNQATALEKVVSAAPWEKDVDKAIVEARSAKEALAGYVKTSVLAGYVSQADLGPYAKTTVLTEYVKKSDYDTKVAALEAEITALESVSTSTSTSTSTGGVTWLVGQQASYTLKNGPDGEGDLVTGTLSTPLLFQITNPTGQVERNIILTLTTYFYNGPADWVVTGCTASGASGGTTPLQSSVSSTGNYVTTVLWNTISGVDGFELAAGETKMVSVSLNIGYSYTDNVPSTTGPTVVISSSVGYTGHS